jgi:hypothetical protein
MPKYSVIIPQNAPNYKDFIRDRRIKQLDPNARAMAVYKPISLMQRQELKAELKKKLDAARKLGQPTKFQALFDR